MGSTLGALKGTGMAIRVSHMVRTELDLGEEDKSHLPAHRDECKRWGGSNEVWRELSARARRAVTRRE
jgi:hypothetical protein